MDFVFFHGNHKVHIPYKALKHLDLYLAFVSCLMTLLCILGSHGTRTVYSTSLSYIFVCKSLPHYAGPLVMHLCRSCWFIKM